MRRSATILRLILLVILPLLCGTVFYIFSGHTHLSIFPVATNNVFFHWLLHHLPDALWTFSLTSLMLIIWKNELNSFSMPFIGAGIFLGLIFELLQKWGMMKGTFDAMDIFVSLGAGILALVISRPEIRFFDRVVKENNPVS